MNQSYNDLVPSELADQLIAIRDSVTRNAWAIGDITDQVIRFNESNGRDIEIMSIYQAVAMFAGKASRTVREYNYLSRFYPPEIREIYSVLAYDHFRFAATMGDRWEECLIWAIDKVDELNRPPTVDMLEAHFAIPDPQEPETPPKDGEGTIKQIWRLSTQILNLSGNWEVEDGDLQRAVSRLNKSCLEVADLCESIMAEEAT